MTQTAGTFVVNRPACFSFHLYCNYYWSMKQPLSQLCVVGKIVSVVLSVITAGTTPCNTITLTTDRPGDSGVPILSMNKQTNQGAKGTTWETKIMLKLCCSKSCINWFQCLAKSFTHSSKIWLWCINFHCGLTKWPSPVDGLLAHLIQLCTRIAGFIGSTFSGFLVVSSEVQWSITYLTCHQVHIHVSASLWIAVQAESTLFFINI